MLFCYLVAASLTQLFAGGFTPTDMTNPPTAGWAWGGAVARSTAGGSFDTSGHGHMPRGFGCAERWNKPAFAGLVGSS